MSCPFARTHPLPGGPPVRLRLARRSDAPAVRNLLAGLAGEPVPYPAG